MLYVLGAETPLGVAIIEHCNANSIANKAYACHHLSITDSGQVQQMLMRNGVNDGDVVVNCAEMRGDCYRVQSALINAVAPHLLFQLVARTGAKFVHVSTDCVYSGWKWSGRAMHMIEETPTPATHYGRTKLAGEPQHRSALTIRTAYVTPDAGLWRALHGLPEGAIFEGYRNVFWSGSTVWAVAEEIVNLAFSNRTGLVHLATEAPVTKLYVAETLAALTGRNIKVVGGGPRVDRSLTSTWVLPPLEKALENIPS